jgi:hypothetical protein
VNRDRPFIRRAGLWLPVWVLTIAAIAVNAWAGAWVNVALLLTIGLLSVNGEAQHQRATDAEAERDEARDDAIAYRLRLAARYPRADWED